MTRSARSKSGLSFDKVWCGGGCGGGLNFAGEKNRAYRYGTDRLESGDKKHHSDINYPDGLVASTIRLCRGNLPKPAATATVYNILARHV